MIQKEWKVNRKKFKSDKKILFIKSFGPKEILVEKKIWSENKFDLKKFRQKSFVKKKIFSEKKFCLKKDFGPKKGIGPKKNFGSKKIWSPKKFG